MLSSGMFAPRRPSRMPPAGGPARRCGPARRGGPVRPCASSVFSATSAISVFTSALSPKNPSFVFIQLRTLSFSVYNIFPFKRFAFNPFRTLSRNTGGVYQLFPKWNSTLSTHPAPTHSTSFFSHSSPLFCTQEKDNSFILKRFRTLCAKHGGGGTFLRIRKGMRTPRNAAPRGLSNFVSGISSRVDSDFRFRLPPSAPFACSPNALHSPPLSSSPAAAPPSLHHCPAGNSPPRCPSLPSAAASLSDCPAAGPGHLPWRPVLPRSLSSSDLPARAAGRNHADARPRQSTRRRTSP